MYFIWTTVCEHFSVSLCGFTHAQLEKQVKRKFQHCVTKEKKQKKKNRLFPVGRISTAGLKAKDGTVIIGLMSRRILTPKNALTSWLPPPDLHFYRGLSQHVRRWITVALQGQATMLQPWQRKRLQRVMLTRNKEENIPAGFAILSELFNLAF